MYRNIPRSFIRYLRVCCVRTPELAPLPAIRNWEYIDNDLLPSSEEKTSPLTRRIQPNREFDEAAYAHAMARQVQSPNLRLNQSLISVISLLASLPALVCEAMSDALTR
jgi:hypothetical protein